MSFLRAGDITVHYNLAGPAGAPVVMMSNSLGTSLAIWDPQAEALLSRFRVLRYDTRGHGLTDCPTAAKGYTIDQLSADAVALLDALELDAVHFCGLSIGGLIGQRLAATAPQRVKSLILCDTAPRIGPPQMWDDRVAAIRKGGIEVIAEGTMQRWFTTRFQVERQAELAGIRNMLVRTPPEGYIGCSLAIRDAELGPDDRKISCPTLVVVGESDPATPPSAAREIADAIKGARLELIANAAHIVTIEQPAALNRLLTGFLGAGN
jgi:3-oxoadipate enol-lactonase